jgi:CRP-like cAMP-binding protein
VPPSFPHSDEEVSRLSAYFTKTVLLAHLDNESRQNVINAMERKEFPNGTDIISQVRLRLIIFSLLKGVGVDSLPILHNYSGRSFPRPISLPSAPRLTPAPTVVEEQGAEGDFYYILDQGRAEVWQSADGTLHRDQYPPPVDGIPSAKRRATRTPPPPPPQEGRRRS